MHGEIFTKKALPISKVEYSTLDIGSVNRTTISNLQTNSLNPASNVWINFGMSLHIFIDA